MLFAGDKAGIMDAGMWTKIGHFSRFHIMALGEKRRLVDPDTGNVYREYTVPVNSGVGRFPSTTETTPPEKKKGV